MTGIVVVLAFPLITAFGFAAIFLLYRMVGGMVAAQRLDQHGFYFYPLFLLLAFAVVATGEGTREALVESIGDVPGGAAGPLLSAAAVVGGAALYYAEIGAAGAAERAAAKRPALEQLLEGRSETLAGFNPPLIVFVTVSILVAGIEEWLWRGFLISELPDELGAALGVALVVSAVAFGLNHYYFGLRNVVAKSAHGFVWGVMYVATGSLLLPVLSHATFELMVVKGMRQRRMSGERAELGAEAR